MVITKFHYVRLRKRMKEQRYTIKALAAKIGMDRGSLSDKLNSKVDFTQKDMISIATVLGIDLEEISNYFFE